jgi:DNA-binding transcriptional regulator LsrR (DeoR family)
MKSEKWEEKRLIAKIATMYYIDDLSQSEIAEKVKIHRTTISRLLKRAREEGIVNISINDEYNECLQLEKRLEEVFNLKEACVIPSLSGQSEAVIKKRLGAVAAELLLRIINKNDVVGFAWGTTMAAVAESLLEKDVKRESVTVIPLVGGPENLKSEYHVNTIVSKVATGLKAKSLYLYAPAITANKKIKDTIIQDDSIKKIVELWDKVNIAVVGIGAPLSSSNMIWSAYFRGNTGNDDREILEKEGAVGEVCSRFYDINGRIIKSVLDDRTISIDLERMRHIPYSIGVAESVEKVPSIYGALKGGFINILITSEVTARRLLEFDTRGGEANV